MVPGVAMIRQFVIIFVRLYNMCQQLLCFIVNHLVLSANKVNYSSFPIIQGRLIIRNRGSFSLGKNITFRCRLTSNFVGLYKPTTIYIKPNAILEIEDNSGFSGVSIYCSSHIKIGKYVNCGGNVSIWDTDFHPLNHNDRRLHNLKQIASKPIIIEDDVFIGANSIILKGITIGARSIIGAGSVVTKNIPCDEIWAGNPAKFIRRASYEK